MVPEIEARKYGGFDIRRGPQCQEPQPTDEPPDVLARLALPEAVEIEESNAITIKPDLRRAEGSVRWPGSVGGHIHGALLDQSH